MFRQAETILFILYAVCIHVLTLLQLNSTFFFYGIGQFLLVLLFFITIIYSIVKIIRNKKQIPLLNRLKPLLIGLVIIPTFPLASYIADPDSGKTIIIQAYAGGDLTFVGLRLHSDGTFRLINSGPLGGQIYRGKYSLKNDTLRIDNGDLNLYPSLTFIKKQDTTNNMKYFDPLSSNNFAEASYQLYINDNSNKER